MRQGGAGGWCCPFLARWRGPSSTGHAAHLCRVTFPFLAPSRPWPAKEQPLAVVLCSAHKEPPRSRQCRRHPGQRPGLRVPSPQPPGPAVPPARISPRGDELCMAHRPGPDFSYSRRGPRVWGGAKCPLIPHEPHRGRGTPQHFPCPFSASPDWSLWCESPWLPMPAASTSFRYPVALGKQSLGGCLLAGNTASLGGPRELSLWGLLGHAGSWVAEPTAGAQGSPFPHPATPGAG